MFGDPRGLPSFEDPFVDAVDDKATLLFAIHKSRMTKHTEMVRDRDDFGFQTVGQLAHVQWADSQSVDDFDPQRFTERTQLFRTMVRLQRVGSHVVSVDVRTERSPTSSLAGRKTGPHHFPFKSAF